MKRTRQGESPAVGLKKRLDGLPKPSRTAKRLRLLAVVVTAGCLLALAMTFLAAFNPKDPARTMPQARTPVLPPSVSQTLDQAEMRAVIFKALDTIGMDAGRYALDPRRAPDITTQGGLFEVTGEVSLLNQPDNPSIYYAIVEQSGPVTSLRLLRVGSEVIYRR